MFKRKIETILYENYKDEDSKILIVDGARQIGKTYIIRYTASNTFQHFVEVNLKDDFDGEKLFENVKSTKEFYIILSSFAGNNLDSFSNTLIFLDEIQVYPHLISLMKALKQDKKYRFIASGSLLGITLKHSFIPMGSILEIKMYPMDFEEFLWANGVGDEVINYLHDCYTNLKEINESIHNKFLNLFKDYLVCGGLPDAVTEYVINKNVQKMRIIHIETLKYYRDDCSQYDEEHKLKITRIYDLLISNMANKVKRIQFNNIESKSNTHAKKYDDEFDYLTSSGIVLQARAVSNPIFPLSQTSSKNLIKLYYNDVGILSNLLYHNNVNAILNNDCGINLGSIYETAVIMELISHGHESFYFDSKKVGEVDFLINDYATLSILPIEIKSGNDQTNFRAIPKLINQNGPYKMSLGYVFGNKNIVKKEGNLVTLPIYLVMFI